MYIVGLHPESHPEPFVQPVPLMRDEIEAMMADQRQAAHATVSAVGKVSIPLCVSVSAHVECDWKSRITWMVSANVRLGGGPPLVVLLWFNSLHIHLAD